MLKTSSQNKDKDRAPIGLMLYGNGDGGGGPTTGKLLQMNYSETFVMHEHRHCQFRNVRATRQDLLL